MIDKSEIFKEAETNERKSWKSITDLGSPTDRFEEACGSIGAFTSAMHIVSSRINNADNKILCSSRTTVVLSLNLQQQQHCERH